MLVSDLDYKYPPELVATTPHRPSRVLLSEPEQSPRELHFSDLKSEFRAGDLLVINDTKVIPARIFSREGLEFLFVRPLDERRWEVLFPARGAKPGAAFTLPGGVTATLQSKGLPQTVQVSEDLTADYFEVYGEVALPPYIQQARGERHSSKEDRDWYQSAWAEKTGSSAAPTASLHFTLKDLADLEANGVKIGRLTLHVGLGTFLPIKTESLNDHDMHCEEVHISSDLVQTLKDVKSHGGRVWALGTTVTRALESLAAGKLERLANGDCAGATDLFIRPPYTYQIVDVLMTNFHQPRSTLLSLVMAFAGVERTRTAYAFAVENHFRLFSYGDLSVWKK